MDKAFSPFWCNNFQDLRSACDHYLVLINIIWLFLVKLWAKSGVGTFWICWVYRGCDVCWVRNYPFLICMANLTAGYIHKQRLEQHNKKSTRSDLHLNSVLTREFCADNVLTGANKRAFTYSMIIDSVIVNLLSECTDFIPGSGFENRCGKYFPYNILKNVEGRWYLIVFKSPCLVSQFNDSVIVPLIRTAFTVEYCECPLTSTCRMRKYITSPEALLSV